MITMIFHRSGRISVRHDFRKGISNLAAISSDRKPVPFLTIAMTAHVRIEPGTSLKSILAALLPWQKTLKGLSGVDIGAWHKHLTRRLTPAERKEAKKLAAEYREIRLFRSQEFSVGRRTGKMKFRKIRGTTLNELVFSKVKPTGYLEVGESWNGVAVYRRPKPIAGTPHVDRCSTISLVRPEAYAGLPVVIGAGGMFQKTRKSLKDDPDIGMIREYSAPKELYKGASLFNRAHPLIGACSKPYLELPVQTSILSMPQGTFAQVILDALLNCFIDLPTPMAAKRLQNELATSAQELELELEKAAKAKTTSKRPPKKAAARSKGKRNSLKRSHAISSYPMTLD